MKRVCAAILVVVALAGCNDSPTTPLGGGDPPDISPVLVAAFGEFGSHINEFAPTVLRVIDGQLWVLERLKLSVYSFSGEHIRTLDITTSPRYVRPTGFDRSADGTIYMAYIDHRIRVFDNAGLLLRSWSAVNTSSGPNRLARIVLDGRGHLYVVDKASDAIHKFDLLGTPILSWSGADLPEGGFVEPDAILIDRDGNVVVGDNVTGKISTFTPEGRLVRWFSTGVRSLEDVLQGPDGSFFVTDKQTRDVLRFTADGGPLARWGKDEDGLSYSREVSGLAMDDEGRLHVADRAANRVTQFDQAGAYLGEFQFLAPLGALDRLAGVAVHPDGFVYTLDGWSPRVQKFSRDGTVLGQWGPPGIRVGQLHLPMDIEVDAKGNVYVLDSRKLTRFDADGRILDWWLSNATALTVIRDRTQQEHLYTGGGYISNRTRIQQVTTDGEVLWTWDGQDEGLILISDIVGIPARFPDKDVTLYVLDGPTAKVHELGPKRGILNSWSVAEVMSPDPQKKYRRGKLEIDHAGRILVSSYDPDPVIGIYSPDGNFLARWSGQSGETAARFDHPTGLDIDGDGNIWVSDFARIRSFAPIELPEPEGLTP